jgi:hypothetical protein
MVRGVLGTRKSSELREPKRGKFKVKGTTSSTLAEQLGREGLQILTYRFRVE